MNTMSEKYTIVQHEKRLFWLQDCPVLLHSYALTKNNTNNSIFLQCKFENIADKPIKAMNIAVKCSDVSHQELANVDNFPYLDINVQPYMLFADKTPVALPDNTTRNVCIIPLKVIFSDDTTWENTSERAYELAEYEQQPISSLGELADQYKRDLHKICIDSEKHNYLPANVNGFTICGCGKVVKAGIPSCPACGVTIEKLFGLNNAAALQEHLENYQTAQAKSQQQQQTKKREMRKRVRRLIIAGIIAVLAITIHLGYSTIQKNSFMKAFEQAQAYSDRFVACEDLAAYVTEHHTVTVILPDPYGDVELQNGDWQHDIQSIDAHDNYIVGTRLNGSKVEAYLRLSDYVEISTQELPSSSQTDDSGITKSAYAIKLLKDGTMVYDGEQIPKLRNIVDIAYEFHDGAATLIALAANGQAYQIDVNNPLEHPKPLENWNHITQISGDTANIIGLHKDGTVVALGSNDYGQCNVEDWTDIVAVKAERNSVYGIKKDGTIVGAGYIPEHCKYDLGDLKLW